MSWLHIMIFIPFVFAIFIPLLYKLFNEKFHIGWLIIPIPLLIFLYLASYIPTISTGKVMTSTLTWIPSLGIEFDYVFRWFILAFWTHHYGYRNTCHSLFHLLYVKRREVLHNFYVYLCLFMGALLVVVF